MNVQERWEAVGSGGFGFKPSYASTTLPTLAETLRASTGTRMARRARSRRARGDGEEGRSGQPWPEEK